MSWGGVDLEFGPESWVNGISADGSTVVGWSLDGNLFDQKFCTPKFFDPPCREWGIAGTGTKEAYRWTVDTGVVRIDDSPDGFPDYGGSAEGASADGRIIVGSRGIGGGRTEAFWWTPGVGMFDLGFLPGDDCSSATGVSDDGFVIAGTSGAINCSGTAFRFTLGSGMQDLGSLLGGSTGSSEANAISANGLAVVGQSSSPVSGEEAFRWTPAGGMEALGRLEGGESWDSAAFGVSADGSVVVGYSGFENSRWSPFWYTDGTGMQHVDESNPYGFAQASSADGSLIVGGSSGAFVWDAGNGRRNLAELLIETYAVDLTGWQLDNATAVSADGRTIAGHGTQSWLTAVWRSFLPNPYVVVADDFGRGALSLVTTGPGPAGEASIAQAGLPTSAVLGGARTLTLQARGAAGNATAVLTETEGADALIVSLPADGGVLWLDYAPTTPVDLTHGGSQDRLELELAAADAPAFLSVVVEDDAGALSAAVFVPVSGPGRVDLPFSSFLGTADLTQVSTLSVNLDATQGGQWQLAALRSGRPPACSDGNDNDGDGLVDHPQDPECVDAQSEHERASCQDGIDRDGDGLADFPEDPGCAAPSDASERGPALVCDDGLDNDDDGLADFPFDPGCASYTDASELDPAVACDDGIDNDGDGWFDDREDPGCHDVTDTSERGPHYACDDGVDGDGDGIVDHPLDPGCSEAWDDSERGPDYLCDDGVDNDGDGLADYPDDPGCPTAAAQREDPQCDDDSDNDGDGAIDWDGGSAGADPDPQCIANPWRDKESAGCGIGFELAPILGLLLSRRTRRRQRRIPAAAYGLRSLRSP